MAAEAGEDNPGSEGKVWQPLQCVTFWTNEGNLVHCAK